MADKKAMNTLFVMCTGLKKGVELLRAEISELRETKKNGIHPEVDKHLVTLTEGLNAANTYTEEEVERIDLEIGKIRDHV